MVWTRWSRSLLAAACCVCPSASAQTNPLATLSGRITDSSGAPVESVAVTVTSPALQGVRDATSTAAGDYRIPHLPPGDYEIVFRRDGFRETRAARTLHATESSRFDARIELAGVAAAITVTAEPASIVPQRSAIGTLVPATLLDRLPVERGPRGATLLTPGAAAAGPGGNVSIAGALSYDNLYLVDGVGVKDRVFGQPRPFPIEDAIDEIATLVTSISAEYGRFSGGVVHVVTRSGGNELGGSLRVTLQSERWRSLTPYEREVLTADPRAASILPTYEATLGGRIVRDRLWYFAAGRRQESTRAETLTYTDLPYTYRSRESRAQAKLTLSPRDGQSVRLGYEEIDTREENTSSNPILDYASLTPVSTPEGLLSLHATATLGRRLYLEGQASRRRRAPTGIGSRITDLLEGTVLRDASRGGATWHAPRFCAVCGVAPGELRRAEEEDRAIAAKLSGLFSTPRAGAHEIVLGAELFDELRRSNSFQSGSGFTVTASEARFDNGAIYPVFQPGGSTVIEWQPIFELSAGSRFRTVSAFVNDRWRIGERWNLNLGLRWDAETGRDQSRVKVSDSDAWSPRLAASFDPRGDGRWSVDAGFARYATSHPFSIGDLGTRRGRPARFAYTYGGPPVNAGPSGAAPVPSAEALAILFDWFFAHGGTGRPLRQAPAIPGLNRRVGARLEPPTVDETSLGISRRFGGRGTFRLAGVGRRYRDPYGERADLTTGQVTDAATGSRYDLRLVGNSDRAERTYEALLAQFDLRVRRGLRLAGSYALSSTRGNFDGEEASPTLGGPTPEAELDFFPEYGEPRWRAPSGPLRTDQRHRARLWVTGDLPLADRAGTLSASLLQRADSGRAWSAVGQVDPRPYVTNPGYVGPPARVPYYFSDRGAWRAETEWATDLALHYAFPLNATRRAELFARLVVFNLFDASAQTRPGETTVLTAANDTRLAPFDPFLETPVRGVHWEYAPGFGRAVGAGDHQQPRTFELSLGLRF